MNEATLGAWREAAAAAASLMCPFAPVSAVQVARLRTRLDLPEAFDKLLDEGWPAAHHPPLPMPLDDLLDWLDQHPGWPRELLPVGALDAESVEAADEQGVLVLVQPATDRASEPTVTTWRSRLVEWARVAPLLACHPGIEVDGLRLASPGLEHALREQFPSEALRYLLLRHGRLPRAELHQRHDAALHAARRARWLLAVLGAALIAGIATGLAVGVLPWLMMPLAALASLREQQATRWHTALASTASASGADPVRRRP